MTTKKYISIPNYKERCRNFDHLKNGLIKKYVDDALDLEDRQQQSLFKLTDGKSDDYTFNSGYFHACTGFGKSYLIKAMAEGYFAEEQNKKIVIFEENVNILKQIKKDLLVNSSFSEDDIGTYFGAEKTPEAPILIATYASMEKLLHEVKKESIGLVLCDEAHHILSLRRQKVATEFDHAALYGFTATPHYNTDKECSRVFGNIVDSVTIRKGVESDLLCSFKNGLFVSHIPLDITEAKISSGEYDPVKLAQIFKESHLEGMREELADFYLKSTDNELGRLYGKTTLINVPSQEEADTLAEVFNQRAGQTIAKSYHTNTDETPLQEFNEGKIPVLIQVNKLSEGYNNKKIEICINYPTASKVRSAQRSGRALRRDDARPDKLALVVDVAFKRRKSGDILQEIHDNGQVLFMDVAEEGAIYSESYRKVHPEIDLISSQVPSIRDDASDTEQRHKPQFLFDVMTDYRDIYKLIYHHMELQEMRMKQPYDLAKGEFASRFNVYRNGQALSYMQRIELFDELVKNDEFIKGHIIKRVLSANLTRYCWALDTRRISDLEKSLGLKFAFRNIRDLPLKSKTDITKEDLIRYFYVMQNGLDIPTKKRRVFFDELCDNDELIKRQLIRVVQSRSQQAYAIDGTKLDDLLAVSGIRIKQKPDILQKTETDINQEDFVRHYDIFKNARRLSKDEKIEIYKQLAQDDTLFDMGLMKTVMAKNLIIQVIDGKKLDEFMHATGLQMKKKIVVQERGKNDISRAEFIRADYTVIKDGKQLVYKDKVRLITQFSSNPELRARGIIKQIRDNDTITYAINGEMLDDLFALTGIKIEKRKELSSKGNDDINLTYFRTNFSVVKDGQPLNFDQKTDFFLSMCGNQQLIDAGIVKTVHYNGHPMSVINRNRLDEIQQIIGYQIQKNDPLVNRSAYDLIKEDFARNYITTVNGRTLINRKERGLLFQQLIQEEKLLKAGIVKKVSPYGTKVIDSSRIDEIQALTGIIISKREKLPQKLASDISLTEFFNDYILKKDGQIMSRREIKEMFNQLIARQSELNGIVKYVQSNNGETFVIDANRLDELSCLTGFDFARREKTSLPQKEDTDVIPTYFFANYQITDNGRILTFNEKKSCCAELLKNEELISRGIVKKVLSGSYQTVVFDGLKFDELFELTGIKLTPLTELEHKKETDIDSGQFSRDYQVIQNERPLSVKEKAKLYKILMEDDELKQLHIIRFVRSRTFDAWVIDGNKLDELARMKGLSISKRGTYPKQQETDITFSNFLHDLKIVYDGVVISRDDKKDLGDKVFADERLLKLGIVRMVQSPFVTVPMIDGTRLDEFEAVTGISIRQPNILPPKEASDIVQSDFAMRYSVLKDGKVLNKAKRLDLFNELTENEELIEKGIIKAVKSQRHELKVINAQKLEELQKITGLTIITPQQKLYELQDKLEHAKTETERNKYQTQLRSMFHALKKRHIEVSLKDKKNVND